MNVQVSEDSDIERPTLNIECKQRPMLNIKLSSLGKLGIRSGIYILLFKIYPAWGA